MRGFLRVLTISRHWTGQSYSSLSPRIVTVSKKSNKVQDEVGRLMRPYIEVAFDNGTTASFLDLWLLDHDPSQLHPTSNQRQRYAIDENMLNKTTIDNVKVDNGGGNVCVTWADGQLSTFGAEYLFSRQYKVRSTNVKDVPESWSPAELSDRLKPITTGPQSRRRALVSLLRNGVAIINGVDLAKTEEMVRAHFGAPRETIYGTMWDTAPKDESDVNDTAYTKDALLPHTDCTYYRDMPGLQVFHCCAQDASAGKGFTTLTDGMRLVEDLKHDHPQTFEFFSTTTLRFHCLEEGASLSAWRKIISLDSTGKLEQLAYNPYDFAPFTYLSNAKLCDFYSHHAILSSAVASGNYTQSVKLSVGDMIVVNNHRVMHGRTAFSGFRNMLGCYVGADDWLSNARCEGLRLT